MFFRAEAERSVQRVKFGVHFGQQTTVARAECSTATHPLEHERLPASSDEEVNQPEISAANPLFC